MRCLALMVSFLIGTAATAEPMGAIDFENYTSGKTLTFVFEGEVFGQEEYRSGRKVIWQVGPNGACVEGRWYEKSPGVICFEYGDRPHCLRFEKAGKNVEVYSVREPKKPPLKISRITRKPLRCSMIGAELYGKTIQKPYLSGAVMQSELSENLSHFVFLASFDNSVLP